jgi:uncharacterized protein with HEPN domain
MKEDAVFVSHILSAVASIELFMEGVSEDVFMASKEKQSAVERQLEIIGEAVKNLSSKLKEAHAHIPWLDIAGMRNNLIHEYFGVDSKITWDTVKNDIVLFKKDIQSLVNE